MKDISGPVHLAGIAALKATGRLNAEEGAGSDLARVRQYRTHAQEAADELMKRERFALEGLARELFLKGRMTSDEVRDVVLPSLSANGRREVQGPSYAEQANAEESRFRIRQWERRLAAGPRV